MTKKNPLSGYFREPKLYTELPSSGVFYDKNIIDWSSKDELAVYAMTAKDELLLKNPDALLNGEAVVELILSCVPQVKKPRQLLQNDIDVLLVAIQGATNETIGISAKCPKCKEQAEGEVRADDLLATMKTVDEEYKFTIDTGLIISVRPYTFESSIQSGMVQFRNTQNLQSLSSIDDDLERIKAFSSSVKDLAALEFDLLIDSIDSILIPSQETDVKPIVVTERDHIKEFFENCDKSIGVQVLEEVKKINQLGIDKKSKLKCEKCSTEDEPFYFDTVVELNPINFFTAS